MTVHYPKGTHRVKIVGQGFPPANEYGQQFMFRIIPDGGEYERTAYHALTNGEGEPAEYSDRTLAIFRMLGFGGQGQAIDFAQIDPEAGHPDHYSFVGLEADAYCQHKTLDDGSEVERWYLNSPGGTVATEPLDKKMTRKLNSLFGKALKQSGGKPAEPPPQASPQSLEEEVKTMEAERDDDIPF